MRTMYDSVTASAIPRNAEIVAGYIDGPRKWSATDWALFPNAVRVAICIDPAHNDGEVLDVETYDARPDQAPRWVTMRREFGVDPSVYCNLSTWPTVAREFNAQGIIAPHYWIAHYDGDPTIPMGAVAKQYRNTAGWDISSVADYWPGIDDNGGRMTISGNDAQLIVNQLMSDQIEVGPEGGPTHLEFYSHLLRLIDDNAATVRNTLTEDNVKQWIRDVLAEQITITGTVNISGK